MLEWLPLIIGMAFMMWMRVKMQDECYGKERMDRLREGGFV